MVLVETDRQTSYPTIPLAARVAALGGDGWVIIAAGYFVALLAVTGAAAGFSESLADRLARSIVDQHGFCVQVHENYYYDPNTRVLTIDWRIMTNSGRVEPTPRHFRYYYRQYTASEIEQLLPKCGFVIQERYGNFDWSPLSAHSKKQILVCAPTAG